MHVCANSTRSPPITHLTSHASCAPPGGGALTATGLLPRATRLLAAGDGTLAAGADARGAVSSLAHAGTIRA
eukprot:scaffold60060_cov53-Phaeocystis_antarctica.AAC.3